MPRSYIATASAYVLRCGGGAAGVFAAGRTAGLAPGFTGGAADLGAALAGRGGTFAGRAAACLAIGFAAGPAVRFAAGFAAGLAGPADRAEPGAGFFIAGRACVRDAGAEDLACLAVAGRLVLRRSFAIYLLLWRTWCTNRAVNTR
jgi:hypothetical protein